VAKELKEHLTNMTELFVFPLIFVQTGDFASLCRLWLNEILANVTQIFVYLPT